MKEFPLSTCEKEFILQIIQQRKRIDGRQAYDYRQTKISFGVDRGCCEVQIGDTRVLAQVSCQVTMPKQTRPTEGVLFVNVELSPMAAPHFESGRMSEQGVEVSRLLERCIRESRCVDLESLCIMSGEKVWEIRVDLNVLNHDGNIADCASVAAITALSHFRRPDVTVHGEEVTVHTLEEKEPLPLSIRHVPMCVTFAFFDQGKFLLVDPSDPEEKVMEGKMVIGMNKHREICTLQMTGNMLLLKEQILRCSNIAVVKVTEMTELIQKALDNDTVARSKGEKSGFAESIEIERITANQTDSEEVDMSDVEEKAQEIIKNGEEKAREVIGNGENMEETEELDSVVYVKGPGTAEVGGGGPSTWGIEEDLEEIKITKTKESHKPKSRSRTPEPTEISDDSEEEDVVILEQSEMKSKEIEKKPVAKSDCIDLSVALKKKDKQKSGKMKTKKK